MSDLSHAEQELLNPCYRRGGSGWYLAPDLVLARIISAREEGRRAAIEECVRLIEDHGEVLDRNNQTVSLWPRSRGSLTGLAYAAAIRALLPKPSQAKGEQ